MFAFVSVELMAYSGGSLVAFAFHDVESCEVGLSAFQVRILESGTGGLGPWV